MVTWTELLAFCLVIVAVIELVLRYRQRKSRPLAKERLFITLVTVM